MRSAPRSRSRKTAADPSPPTLPLRPPSGEPPLRDVRPTPEEHARNRRLAEHSLPSIRAAYRRIVAAHEARWPQLRDLT